MTYLANGQIVFDFLLSLTALSLLFMLIFSVIMAQADQWNRNSELLFMERTCEMISSRAMEAYINGDGYSGTFYTRLPLTLYNGNEIVISESYICFLPTTYSVKNPLESVDGEFRIKNENGIVIVERIV
ncbi:MAG: hypothetical protein ACP5H8_00135 [Candidatus Micrarchaeia archaeon]